MFPTLSTNAPSEEKVPQASSHPSKAQKSWYQKMGYKFKSSPETVLSSSLNLRRNVPYFYDAVTQYFFASVSALTLCFQLTMMVSGFGPYRCLRPNDAPTECTDIIHTPWVMMHALGFVSYRRGHKLLVTPRHNVFVRFF